MGGTIAGGRAAAKTNKAQHGEDFYRRIGAKGGKNGNTGGFYGKSEFASKMGVLGGQLSSRRGVRNGQGKNNATPQV